MQIIRAAEDTRLRPCHVSELHLAQDDFREPAYVVPAHRRMTILVGAPTVQRLPAGRDAQGYGANPADWTPFLPGSVQPVAQAASYIARSFDFEPSILTLEEGLATLDWSDPTTGPGVALIDPWLALDDARAEQLNRLDALDAGWLGAAVIWNQLDQQTTARADDLRKALQGIAPRRLGDAAAPPSLGVVHTHQHRTVPAAAAVGAGRRHSTGISTSAERTSAARHAAGAAVVDGTRTRRHGDARPARHGRLGWTLTAPARW